MLKFISRRLKASRLYGHHLGNVITMMPRAAVNHAEARFLLALAREATPGPIIEIGTLFGASTQILALGKPPHVKLITVDNYSWNLLGLPRDVHKRVTGSLLNDVRQTASVEIVDCDKDEFFARYSGPTPSLVFLDALHDYESTLADIDWALRVGATTICGHDYSEAWPGVVRAVTERGGLSTLVGSVFVLSQADRKVVGPMAAAEPSPHIERGP